MREIQYQEIHAVYIRLLQNIFRERGRVQEYSKVTFGWHLKMKLSFCAISFRVIMYGDRRGTETMNKLNDPI